MKKILFALALLASFASHAHGGDVFHIRNAGDWHTFAVKVNDAVNRYDVDAVLDADITTSEHVGVTRGAYYRGTFNGNGHTLTFNKTWSGERYIAPFRYVGNATIRNLHTTGTIESSEMYPAGIVAEVWHGSAVIENCISSVTLKSTMNGDGTLAGLVGRVSSGNVSISNCKFDGSFEGANCYGNGGFVSWVDEVSSAVIQDCLFTPDHINTRFDACRTWARQDNRGTVTVTNSYATKEYSIFSISNSADWATYMKMIDDCKGEYWVDASLEADISIVNTAAMNPNAPIHGTFYGNGHTITVDIKGGSLDYISLFRYGRNFYIRDLNVKGKISAGNNISSMVGKAEGVNGANKIDNCRISTKIEARSRSGGFIGEGNADIVNCLFDGNITCGDGLLNYAAAFIYVGDNRVQSALQNCLDKGTYRADRKALNLCGFHSPYGWGNDANPWTKNNWSYNNLEGADRVGNKSPSEMVAILGSGWKLDGTDVVPKVSYRLSDNRWYNGSMPASEIVSVLGPGNWEVVNGKAVPVMTNSCTFLSVGSSSGKRLGSGTYYVTNDVTFTGGAGQSGLTIAEGATVHIHIAKGATLTARGGNASGRTGAGAGIELANRNTTLYLEGAGRVVAEGGNAANGGDGGDGSNADYSKSSDRGWVGSGGNGGDGGGGAGAGIGTRGGDGGSGGIGPNGEYIAKDRNGTSGSDGGKGGSSLGMGRLLIEQTYGLTVSAKGGSAGRHGKGGSAGKSYIKRRSGLYENFSMSGGGGGGAGGAGGSAYDIGDGGAGGGGGGSGASGAMGTKQSGYYAVYAEWGDGGKNGDGGNAPDGGKAGADEWYLSHGYCSSDYSWSDSDCNKSGGGAPGGRGKGGGAGLKSIEYKADIPYLVRFNVMENRWITRTVNAGYLANLDYGPVTFRIPTNLELGLTDINRYVTQWHTNNDGTGNLIRANDVYTTTRGIKDVYDTWKNYKDIFPEGSGTASSPFIIAHGELLSLADYVNACGNTRGLYFRQKSDILIENILNDANQVDSKWIPIGYDQKFPFEGDYDGNGHVIRKGEIANQVGNQSLNIIGVFGIVLGSVHNLGVEDMRTSTGNNNARCGAIAGMLCRKNDQFTNKLVQAASMSNCYAANNSIDAYYAGGLVGEMQEYTSMSHCHETGCYLSTNNWGSLASIIDSNAKLDVCFTAGKHSGNGYSGATNSPIVNSQRITSGELTWLLNDRSASTGVTWYQTLGSGAAANAYPVLDKNSSRVYSDGKKYSNSPLGIYAFPGKGTKEEPYQIATAYDLQQIALYCKDGNKSSGLYFIQTADIDMKDVKDYTPVGYDVNHAFEGCYDGGGHTIRNANITAKVSQYAGIFGVVKGTVNRLCVENSTFVGVKYGNDDGRAGGIAAQVTGNGVISNCFVKGCDVKISGIGVAGGVASEMFGKAAIRNCLVYRTKGSATRFAHFCSDTRSGTEISRCYTDGNKQIEQRDVKITDSQANVEAAPLASGEICYELNGADKKADPAWFQNLNHGEANDSTPVLSSEHAMVFERNDVYSNDKFDIGRLGKGTKESPYKIKNAEELQQIVQSMGIMKRSDFYIEQTADIDMAGEDMVPIGTCTESFSGHYDGGGHVISNIVMQHYEGQSMGLFNNISGTVERLGIVNSTFRAVSQITRVGAFAGKMMGNGVLRNCFVAGSTVDFNNTAGVVVGALVGEQTDASRIESCYGFKNKVTGQFDGLNHFGHVVGYIGSNAAIDHAYTDGKMLSADRQSGAGNIVNSEKDVAIDRFKTGEVCWLLSGSRNESKSAWGQTIRTDSIPMPNSNAHLPVYRHTIEQLAEYTNTDEVPYNTTLYLDPNYDGGGSETVVRTFRNDPRYYIPAVNLQQFALVRKYYYLSCWNTKADGTGTSYAVDAKLIPDSPLTLYAIWVPKVPADGTRQVYKLETENATVKVYDEGGKNSLYDINYNGKLVLRAPSKHIIRLSGTVTTEALDSVGKPRDYLKVYDGDELGDILVNDRAKNDSVFCSTTDGAKEDIGVLMSSSNELTVEFVSDGENNFQGLDLTVTVLPKAIRDLGRGSKDDPFRVVSVEDLQTVNDYMSRTNDSEIYIVQTADIDMAGAAFTPLASGVESFKGHYDGGGHVIRNGKIKAPVFAGLFSVVTGTVTRLGMEGMTVNYENRDGRSGAIAARISGNGEISYCYVKGCTVTSNGIQGYEGQGVAGAIVSDMFDQAVIKNCYSYQNTVAATRAAHICADTKEGTQISQCYTDGNNLYSQAVATVTTSEADVKAERFTSGEVCYLLNATPHSDQESENGSKSESVVWRQTIGTDSLPTLDESNGVVYCHDIFGKNVYTNSPRAKYEVHTVEEFKAIKLKEGDIYLMNDLDLGEWTSDRKFQLKGNFDGGGHTITYSGKDAFQGLFNTIQGGASVKHLRVKAKISAINNCAGIACRNNGIISDCTFTGNVVLKYIKGYSSETISFAGIANYLGDKGSVDHCSVTGYLTLQNNKRSEIPVINPYFSRKKTPNYWTSVSYRDKALYAAQADTALSVQADYPVYAKGILDVTKPKIVHGDQTYLLTSRHLAGTLTITDGVPFSCSTQVTVDQVKYERKGTNGAYEPWILPFDYTITSDLLQEGVEFYRFEKDSVNNIQVKQITADAPYQVEANEPLLFRCDGNSEREYRLLRQENGNMQHVTIKMPLDGKAAKLESTKDICRVMVNYSGSIPADSTVKAMMYVWNDGEKDFKLSDGTQAITPFRYYLQYIDNATGNLEEYEQTDWWRKEQKYKGKKQKSVTGKEAKRAALSEMTAQGWQPIFIATIEPLTVTAEMLEDYDILMLSDLYDQEAATVTGEQQFDVALVYEPAEEGVEIESGLPLLVKARNADAAPLVTDEMVSELEGILAELSKSENEEDLYEILDALHYSYSTFKGEYHLWLMPLPESDSVLNECGAFAFADKGYDQYFWRVPNSDATSLTPMSYCFTAYDARTYENLPVSNDRIEIVVYASQDTETGIETVRDSKSEAQDARSKAQDSEATYNLNGQRVGNYYRGIVVKNGKKIIK